MQLKALGHVVLKVRDLERSVAFYRDVLGMKEVARHGDTMAFFSLGKNHHDFAVLQIGALAETPAENSIGLYHVAFKVGDSLDELRECKAHLERHGVAIAGESDHGVSQSLYIGDPDGITIELYVDAAPEQWRDDPGAMLTTRPLHL